MAALPDVVIGQFGAVDGIINNAGIIQPFKPVNDLLDTAVRVTAVFPGAIATNITENSGLGKPKAGSDEAMKSRRPA